MANVHFFGNPYHGHTIPTLAVVKELVRRGEQVVYYNTEKFEDAIAATGAKFRPYPDLGDLPGLEPGVDLTQWILGTTQRILDDELCRVQREQPDYLITDVAAVWGVCVARALGIPFLISNPMFSMNFQIWEFARKIMPRRKWRRKSLAGLVRGCFTIAKVVNQIRKKHRLRVSDILPTHSRFDQIVYTSRLVQPFSDHLGSNVRFVGAPGVERVETEDFDFGRLGGSPLVFVSMGTFLTANPTLVQTCFEALGNLDVQVLMILSPDSYPELVDEAAANFIFVKHAPQLAVLKRATLFITHGGVGSASEALYHGVPMVVLPEAYDHFLMAHRVAEEGAGIMFGETPSSDQLAEAVHRVLSDASFAGNARRLGMSLSEAGGARRAADEIIAWSLASSHSGRT